MPTTLRTLIRSPYDREIARLAIPALGSLIAEPLYVLVDTAIVGNIGTNELAGLALASTVLLTLHAAAIFLAYGTTGPVARLIGSGNEIEAGNRSIQGLWLGLFVGLAGALFLAVLGSPILELIGGSGEVLVAARTYLFVSLPGLPFLLIALAANGSFHGRQDAKTPLVLAIIGAVGNLVIELVLINGLGYGIGASALSTVIAQTVVGVISVVLVVRWARTIGASTAPDGRGMRSILATSKALFIRTMSLRGSFTLSTAIAARVGVADVAAHQIALGIWSTLALALDAVAIAGQALTGKWLGVGDKMKARAATKRMIEVDVFVGVVVGAGILVARQPLSELFSNDPAVVSITAFLLVHLAVQQPLNGVVFALDGILIGASDLNYLAISMLGAGVLFAAMAAVVVATGAGVGWLWAAIAVFMAARAVPLVLRWRQDAWLVEGAG